MKYRLLAAAPFVYAAAVALAAEWLPAPVWRAGFAASYGLAAVASLATALLFGRGDRLRWAWLFLGLSYAIGFASRVAIGADTGTAVMSPWLGTVWSALTIGLNVAGLAGEVALARVWSGTGLAPAWRWHVTLVMLALGLLVDGKAVLDTGQAMLHGDRQSIGLLVSTVCDIASIALVGPIFATMLALRGGLLVYPWAFLFACSLAWLLDDATVLLSGKLFARADLICRLVATQFGVAAALAQRWVTASLAAVDVRDGGDEVDAA